MLINTFSTILLILMVNALNKATISQKSVAFYVADFFFGLLGNGLKPETYIEIPVAFTVIW